jgi:FlaA1/EpsC-like NDP-sugar epimerase
MGELISIYEMVLCLIRSKNMIPGIEVVVRIIGLKPGEKIVEELLTDVEKSNLIKANISNIFLLKNFEKVNFDVNLVIGQLQNLVKKYSNHKKLVLIISLLNEIPLNRYHQ